MYARWWTTLGIRTSENTQLTNFLELRACEVRLCPGPMGEKFSGSWSVTSRNPLIHNGATNATWSGHFYPEAVPPCRSGVLAVELGGSLATPNFREHLYYDVDGYIATVRFRARPCRSVLAAAAVARTAELPEVRGLWTS